MNSHFVPIPKIPYDGAMLFESILLPCCASDVFVFLTSWRTLRSRLSSNGSRWFGNDEEVSMTVVVCLGSWTISNSKPIRLRPPTDRGLLLYSCQLRYTFLWLRGDRDGFHIFGWTIKGLTYVGPNFRSWQTILGQSPPTSMSPRPKTFSSQLPLCCCRECSISVSYNSRHLKRISSDGWFQSNVFDHNPQKEGEETNQSGWAPSMNYQNQDQMNFSRSWFSSVFHITHTAST